MVFIFFKVVSLRIDTTNPAFLPCLESVNKSFAEGCQASFTIFFSECLLQCQNGDLSYGFSFSGTRQSHMLLIRENMEGVGRRLTCFYSNTVLFWIRGEVYHRDRAGSFVLSTMWPFFVAHFLSIASKRFNKNSL